MSEPRKFHPDLPAFDGKWTGVPVFFVDELMRLGKWIPSAFFKLTFVVWRDVVAPTRKEGDKWIFEYTCKKTEKQFQQDFNINKSAVADWTRAYSVSGLFEIRKGKRHRKDLPGEPTIWQYNKNATIKDWQAFIIAVSKVCKGTQ